MSAEDQEILTRIGQIAGQINRHKNQQAGLVPSSNPYSTSHHNSSYPYPHRARGRAFHPRGPLRSTRMPVHRHRSLVLNGASADKPADASDSAASSDPSLPSWISKTDRHMQLINSSVYEKEIQARVKAIEQTRIQKRNMKDEQERSKLASYLGHLRSSGNVPSAQPASGQYEVEVEGIRFRVAKNGSKLIKVEGNGNAPKATPKLATIGGVKFYRTKNGNLYRHGVVRAQRQSGIVKKVDIPCKLFSTTGSCPNGPRCRYLHDPSKVAICKEFLQKGECANGDSCDLSHDATPHRTPACLHFAKGSCTNPNCRYSHVIVSPSAPVCRAFGIYGYCDKGADCPERHVFECPDFSNTGVCKNKSCKLLHRERASVLRKAAATAAAKPDEDQDMQDVSSNDSDDGESVDSHDIDSDEVDEFIGQDDIPDFDFAAQQDFIPM